MLQFPPRPHQSKSHWEDTANIRLLQWHWRTSFLLRRGWRNKARGRWEAGPGTAWPSEPGPSDSTHHRTACVCAVLVEIVEVSWNLRPVGCAELLSRSSQPNSSQPNPTSVELTAPLQDSRWTSQTHSSHNTLQCPTVLWGSIWTRLRAESVFPHDAALPLDCVTDTQAQPQLMAERKEPMKLMKRTRGIYAKLRKVQKNAKINQNKESVPKSLWLSKVVWIWGVGVERCIGWVGSRSMQQSIAMWSASSWHGNKSDIIELDLGDTEVTKWSEH